MIGVGYVNQCCVQNYLSSLRLLQELTLFAMPQTTNNDKPMIDNLRIAFNQNPRPMVYKVSCHGTEPMLHVEPKDFFFGKIVVGR